MKWRPDISSFQVCVGNVGMSRKESGRVTIWRKDILVQFPPTFSKQSGKYRCFLSLVAWTPFFVPVFSVCDTGEGNGGELKSYQVKTV